MHRQILILRELNIQCVLLNQFKIKPTLRQKCRSKDVLFNFQSTNDIDFFVKSAKLKGGKIFEKLTKHFFLSTFPTEISWQARIKAKANRLTRSIQPDALVIKGF